MRSFFDEVRIFVKAGKGGNGTVAFRREKFVPLGGPSGGHGGDGGNVILIADNQINSLKHLYFNRSHKAQDGKSGGGFKMHGKSGDDCIVKVPCGTEILSEDRNTLIYDLVNHGDTFILAKGGAGGTGNFVFKNSVNQAPERSTPGKIGQEGYVILRLKIVGDIGILGMPNAGKSTLLSKITRAKPKIDNYEFTTLEPNVGILETLHENIKIVDIPGLIDEASENKGMGVSFLKHLQRCQMIIHVLDVSNKNAVENYNIIIKEVQNFDKTILEKPMILFLNKIDQSTVSREDIKIKCNEKIFEGSCIKDLGIETLKQEIINQISKYGS